MGDENWQEIGGGQHIPHQSLKVDLCGFESHPQNSWPDLFYGAYHDHSVNQGGHEEVWKNDDSVI